MTQADVTRDVFLDLLGRSKVVDPLAVRRVEARLPGANARQLAQALITAAELTHFQAAKLLRGRWQGLAVGPYRILAPLGRGGMGTVFLARDSRMAEELGDDVLVALKVLPPKVAREEDRMLARFVREIDMGKRVNHPNVARTLAGGEADGVNYLAMEYVPGKTIYEVVAKGGRMPPGEAARVGAEVAAGLAHLHERGLVHRDLKPGNVMVTPDGRTKILDLGLAYSPGEVMPDDIRIVGGKGYIVGTMDYISPEQAFDATAATPRSDLYSLGCMLYFALAGTPPFPGGTAFDKIRRQRTLDPVRLADINHKLPGRLVRVVERLMAKDAKDRPESATAARELLLPFATPPAKAAAFSLRDAVGAVDRPDGHPELWTDDDAPATPGADAGTLPTGRPSWLIAVAFVVVVVVLSALIVLLR